MCDQVRGKELYAHISAFYKQNCSFYYEQIVRLAPDFPHASLGVRLDTLLGQGSSGASFFSLPLCADKKEV